jgi:D-aminopeptidase
MFKSNLKIIFLIFLILCTAVQAQEQWWSRLRVGILPIGELNAITDVAGVRVGQVTLVEGEDCRTGVTAILPHGGSIFQEKVPAAVFVANGFGKLMGTTQVKELGVLETPIVLTNTLSVPTAANAVIKYVLKLPGNEEVRSVNPVVGETNDGYLNNIRVMYVKEEQVRRAIEIASGGAVQEGNVGAGTGTVCFGFKGGIGTSSRKLPENSSGYVVGVLVQTNFGGILRINGAPVGEELGKYYFKEQIEPAHGGSCMMIVATDAPLNARQLGRLAKRAFQGFVRSGGVSTHGSGDYVIAFSTAKNMRVAYQSGEKLQRCEVLRDEALSPLFLAAAEATEEAVYHSLFAAKDMVGFKGHQVKALPVEKTREILEKYNLLNLK